MLDLYHLFLLMSYFERLHNDLFIVVVNIIRILIETVINRFGRCGSLPFKSRVAHHRFTVVFLHKWLILSLYLLVNQAIDHILIQKL